MDRAAFPVELSLSASHQQYKIPPVQVTPSFSLTTTTPHTHTHTHTHAYQTPNPQTTPYNTMPSMNFKRFFSKIARQPSPVEEEYDPADESFCTPEYAPAPEPVVEVLPLAFAQRRAEYLSGSWNQWRHSMAAEVCVIEPPVGEAQSAHCASVRDEDCSLYDAASFARIETDDSWLAEGNSDFFVKAAPAADMESDEESDAETIEVEECSPMSSTETLVAAVEAKPQNAVVVAKLEALIADVPRKQVKVVRQPTLVPLHVAQARADIKYRPEAFEVAEAVEREAQVWWRAL